MAYVTVLLLLVSIIGGTLSFTASSALPGDLLYTYKVDINENVAGLVAYSDDSKVRWNFFTLEERLKEARKLALIDRLDVLAQTQVISNISLHVGNILAQSSKLQAMGSLNEASLLSQRLSQTLTIETKKVADTSALGSASLQVSLASILTRLRTTAATVALISMRAQAETIGINHAIAGSTVVGVNHPAAHLVIPQSEITVPEKFFIDSAVK